MFEDIHERIIGEILIRNSGGILENFCQGISEGVREAILRILG